MNEVEAMLNRLVKADVDEDEELGLGAKESLVGHTGKAQIGFRLASNVARVARVGLLGDGINDVADHHQRGRVAERVHEMRLGVRHQQHVRLVNRGPAADRAAVDSKAVFTRFLAELRYREADVMPESRKIGEWQVENSCVVLGGKF